MQNSFAQLFLFLEDANSEWTEQLYGSDKEWELIEICEIDPDYSEKISRYGAEGYQEYNYNRTTGRHYLRKEKNLW